MLGFSLSRGIFIPEIFPTLKVSAVYAFVLSSLLHQLLQQTAKGAALESDLFYQPLFFTFAALCPLGRAMAPVDQTGLGDESRSPLVFICLVGLA